MSCRAFFNAKSSKVFKCKRNERANYLLQSTNEIFSMSFLPTGTYSTALLDPGFFLEKRMENTQTNKASTKSPPTASAANLGADPAC